MPSTRRSESRQEPSVAARITCQFHQPSGMVYELECDGAQLSLSMSDAPARGGLWRAGAGVRHAHAAPALNGSGTSRGEALSALAAEWTRLGEAAGYPRLDWVAIRTALAAVRAV